MAIAYVQQVFNGPVTPSGSTAPFSPTATAAAGHLVVWYDRQTTTPRGLTSVTDDAGGNTWTVHVSDTTSNNGFHVASCLLSTQLTTSNIITLTYANTVAGVGGSLQEYSGIAATPIDKIASNLNQATTSTPVTGTTATTSQAIELLVGAFQWLTARTITQGSGFTARDFTSGSTSSTRAFEDQIVSSTGTYQAGLTLSGAGGNYAASILTFKGVTSTDYPTTLGAAGAGVATVSSLHDHPTTLAAVGAGAATVNAVKTAGGTATHTSQNQGRFFRSGS